MDDALIAELISRTQRLIKSSANHDEGHVMEDDLMIMTLTDGSVMAGLGVESTILFEKDGTLIGIHSEDLSESG